ncbi:exodeoxyribonuclease VII small subunit [Leptodesmis sp.]|uniref:exodeoxyribonuclease VII small subunit n=1 Tax=Leptodesmis sp. TaxID=3100501 RepID=UPI0040534AC3
MNDVHNSVDNRGNPPNSKDGSLTSPTSGVQREDWNYEQTVQRIEATISRIESGELELAEVFDEFAAAVKSLQECETFLAERQRQMDLLIESLKDEPEF